MADETYAGGLWCSQVLAQLSDYLDNELPAPSRAKIEAHLSECDRCFRFGERFDAILRALCIELRTPEPLTLAEAQRLRHRLLARIFEP